MATQPESKLSRAIIHAIKGGGGYAVKFHGGPMTEAGTPDILACIPCDIGDPVQATVGLFVGIESKTPENHRDDKDGSPIQKRRAEQIRRAGGVVIIPATSVSQVLRALDALGWVRISATDTVEPSPTI